MTSSSSISFMASGLLRDRGSNRPLSGLSWQPCWCLGHPKVLALEPRHQRAPVDQLPAEPGDVFTDPFTAESGLQVLLGTGGGGGGERVAGRSWLAC